MYYLYFDGASRGNPGKASYGYVIKDEQQEIVSKGCGYIGNETNNVAEYLGIIRGMENALDNDFKKLHVYGDSNLIIKQLNKEYKTNSKLKPYFEKGYELLKKFDEIKLEHVKRDKNKEADYMANKALNEL
jgi:ribonuclease HI